MQASMQYAHIYSIKHSAHTYSSCVCQNACILAVHKGEIHMRQQIYPLHAIHICFIANHPPYFLHSGSLCVCLSLSVCVPASESLNALMTTVLTQVFWLLPLFIGHIDWHAISYGGLKKPGRRMLLPWKDSRRWVKSSSSRPSRFIIL